ncbi:small ribosomal subunit protein uS19-like isoform X2 [Cornus florida]|uniref:small ribosomal subunit protein uS19-like isoform X2 n=1 Tax=Cornus florida TaxID=4283 RepID=UPI00289872E0|nr:small ribosomal subunit protein uS19-like isoform X2 [Cornus florida]
MDGLVFGATLSPRKGCHHPLRSQSRLKTHLRNVIIVPEMIGSIIGVYNGKIFNQIEIKPEMINHYPAEFSISYKAVKHGWPGIWCHPLTQKRVSPPVEKPEQVKNPPSKRDNSA